MAKKSMVSRNNKRGKLAVKLAEKRAVLIATVKSEESDYDAKWDAMMALQKLPRDSSKARYRNRCAITGRPHGFFRRFGLSRTRLREVAMRGEVPGLVKASW